MLDAETLVNEWTWKTPAMRQMTIAVCRLALDKDDFSALDLPVQGEREHGGQGIAGSVFRSLAEAKIIEPVGTWSTDGSEFYQRRVRNANGNPVGVWRGADKALARALLRRHAPELVPDPAQMELWGAV